MSIASDKEMAVAALEDVPKVLRALMAEKEKLAGELEQYRKRELAEDIVDDMDKRGLSDPAASFREKVAKVLGSKQSLEVIKEAVAMARKDFSFATVADANNADSEDSEQTFLELIRA